MTLRSRLDHLWDQLERMTPAEIEKVLHEVGGSEETVCIAEEEEREFTSDEVVSSVKTDASFVAVYAETQTNQMESGPIKVSEVISRMDMTDSMVPVKADHELSRAA